MKLYKLFSVDLILLFVPFLIGQVSASAAASQSTNTFFSFTTSANKVSLEVPTSNEVDIDNKDQQCESSDTCFAVTQTSNGIVEASYEVGSPASVQGDRVGSDMGEAQIVDVVDNTDDVIANRIISARIYFQETVMKEDKYSVVRDLCRNQHSQCAFWATIGECEKNPGYMHVNCAPVCYACEKLHVETRCPLDPNASDAIGKPNDLNKMFERILSDPTFQQYEPVVLSRPTYAPGDTAENATYKVNSIWMIMFDNAVSDAEADRLIELGGVLGYARSADVGEKKADGTYEKSINSGRTSTNAWCIDKCYEDPAAISVMDRISNITGIPEPNSENLQILKYEENQFYQTHNDYIEYQVDRPCGVRLLTFYIYLNDVEEGGGTNFPHLGLTVTPKKGRAVLWPSVFNDNPNQKDSRSDHQAMPVIKGIKYGANAWIHQRDFKSANLLGCS